MECASTAVFSVQGCFVEIDGWRGDLASKWGLLEVGCCNVNAVEPGDRERAVMLMDSPVADTGIFACRYPPLVELAARYWRWANGDGPWEACEVEVKPEGEARVALMRWLAELGR